MSRLSEMQGTPWHVEKFTRQEGDERRHRSYCVHYDKALKYCELTCGGCWGASHCNQYSTQRPQLKAQQNYINQSSTNQSSKLIEKKTTQQDYRNKKINTTESKKSEQKRNMNNTRKANTTTNASQTSKNVKESIDKLHKMLDATEKSLEALALYKEKYQAAEEIIKRNVEQMLVNLSCANERINRKYKP